MRIELDNLILTFVSLFDEDKNSGSPATEEKNKI